MYVSNPNSPLNMIENLRDSASAMSDAELMTRVFVYSNVVKRNVVVVAFGKSNNHRVNDDRTMKTWFRVLHGVSFICNGIILATLVDECLRRRSDAAIEKFIRDSLVGVNAEDLLDLNSKLVRSEPYGKRLTDAYNAL